MLLSIWARNPTSFQHLYFWGLFLDPHRPRLLSILRCPFKIRHRIEHIYLYKGPTIEDARTLSPHFLFWTLSFCIDKLDMLFVKIILLQWCITHISSPSTWSYNDSGCHHMSLLYFLPTNLFCNVYVLNTLNCILYSY